MRLLFLGMSGRFSHIVLERLLAADVEVAAVLLAVERFRPLPSPYPPVSNDPLMRDRSGEASSGEQFELPFLNPQISVAAADRVHGIEDAGQFAAPLPPRHSRRAESVLHLAWRAGIPAFECRSLRQQDVSAWLAQTAVDVACVACWNRIIPASALGLPRHGFLNVHPSLLPGYRGPQPLFWQFRAGETGTGVTVHWMDEGLDTGDIVAQAAVVFADGVSGADAESRCASVGGDLLAEALTALAQGQPNRQPQPAGGSYFPAPTMDDFALDANWPVRRAFNFMRATAEWGTPYRLEVDGTVRWLAHALGWQEGAPTDPTLHKGVCIRFGDGALWATESPSRPG